MVTLYLRKSIKDIIYYDVAKALVEFVIGNSYELLDTISDRLSLKLEELKRRGVPVDLLLKKPISKLH